MKKASDRFRIFKKSGKDFIYGLLAKGRKVIGYERFPERIKKRHVVMRSHPNISEILWTEMSASEPIERWRDIPHWQIRLSNKYNSREFAKLHGCQVPGLYWKGNNLDLFDFNTLPKQFVVRPIRGASSKGVYVMDDGMNLLNRKKYSLSQLRHELETYLDADPNHKILIEEFVRSEQGEYRLPDEYKVYMFDGHIACIQLKNRISPTQGSETYYDEHWKQLPRIKRNYKVGEFQNPPKCLPDIIEGAKILSRSYEIFVRVDFYATDQGAVFGEFAAFPGMGNGCTPFGIKYLTACWDKYCPGKI